MAKDHGIRVGDGLHLMGRSFRVVGLSSGTAGFMATYMFVTHAATDQLFGAAGTTSYVLVGAADADATRTRLSAAGLNTRTADQIAAAAQEIASGIFSGPLRLMVIVAFSAGTLVIALTAYTTIIERRREYGIVKALGARPSRLVAMALGQTIVLAVLGLVAGVLLFAGGRAVIAEAKPQFAVLLTSGSVLRSGVAALAMALVAAILPARRLSRLDPATAYRGS